MRAERQERITAAWAQGVVRATLQTEHVWVRACPGNGACVHDEARWFWTLDYAETRCHGRGQVQLARIILSVHRLYRRLVIPSPTNGSAVGMQAPGRRPRTTGAGWRLLRQREGKEELVCEGSRGKCWVVSRKLQVMSLSQHTWSVQVNGVRYRLQRASSGVTTPADGSPSTRRSSSTPLVLAATS